MGAPADLSGAVDLSQVAPTPENDQIVPTVMAVTHRYLVSGVNLTPVEEDGSRVLSLHARGGTLMEASLAPDVLAHLKATLNGEVPEPAADEEAEVVDAEVVED
jgi:hypothetical protein